MRKYFEFYNGVKINCGEGALSTIGTELARFGCKNPLLLTSQTVVRLGVVDKVLKALSEIPGKTSTFDGVPQKVDMDLVREIKKAYLLDQCDGILAIGGEGVIDTAKCLKLFLSQECDEILPITGSARECGSTNPLVVIPTENGSGKEASGDFECGEYYVSTSSVLPNVVIIDEEVAMAAPSRTVAACGIYALANAIEAYFSSGDDVITETYAESTIKLLAKWLETAVNDGENDEACRATALAGTLSGIAYGNAPFGAIHALAEGLSEVSGEPLEEMFAIALIPGVRIAKEREEEKLKNILFFLVGATEYSEVPDSERSERAIQALEDMLEKLHKKSNVPIKISQTKIQRESFGRIAESAANKRSAITAFSPITKETFLGLLNQAY